MNRRHLAAALALGLVEAREGGAQGMISEVITARFRDPAELADVLAPLVPAPGTVSAFADKLIVRTTPSNMAELRSLLATLDTAPANLLIRVRRTLDAEVRRDLAQVEARASAGDVSADVGRVGAGPGASASTGGSDVSLGARVQRSTRARSDQTTQTLRVLEGREAFIRSGESVPVGERQVTTTGGGTTISRGLRYEEFGSGFFVRPRLSGDVVTLDIRPGSRQLRRDGSAVVQETSTAVSGLLGRWIEVAGTHTRTSGSTAGLASSASLTRGRDDALYVKVERVD